MPTVVLNKSVFERLIGKKLPLEQLKDRISMLGTDLEKIEGNEIHVEVFPNRPDMLSEQGFARAFSSFIGTRKGLRKYAARKSGYKVTVDRSVTMRPFTACAIVRNLKFDDEGIREIMQVQEKLATTHGRNRKKSAYGIYPAKNIHFPVSYTAKDPAEVVFQPLGFDRKITASDIEKVHPKGKEYSHIAQGWKKYPFFIDSNGSVMSMLPYTNSHDTGKIDETTKEVFIECSGTDLENVLVALNILVTTLADMGGEICSMDIEYPDKTITTPDLEPWKMKVDIAYINRILGLELAGKDIKGYLERMGYGYAGGTALVPAYRADILHQIDLVEDIAIAYGYENFKAEIPKVSTIAGEDGMHVFSTKLAQLMAGFGFLETSTYHLSNNDELNSRMNIELPFVKLKNALTSDYNALRSWMLPSLMKILGENTHHEYPQRLFEIGTVFKEDSGSETGVAEFKRLAAASAHANADFTEAKQALDALLRAFGIEYTAEDAEHSSFIPGRVCRIVAEGKKVAYAGEIHPAVLEKWGIGNPVAAFELNVSELMQILAESNVF